MVLGPSCPKNYTWFRELLSFTRFSYIRTLVAHKFTPFNQLYNERAPPFRPHYTNATFQTFCWVRTRFFGQKFSIHVPYSSCIHSCEALCLDTKHHSPFTVGLYRTSIGVGRRVSNSNKNVLWQLLTPTKIDTIAKMVVCRQLFGRALCVCQVWLSRVHPVHVRSDFLFKIIEK